MRLLFSQMKKLDMQTYIKKEKKITVHASIINSLSKGEKGSEIFVSSHHPSCMYTQTLTKLSQTSAPKFSEGKNWIKLLI